MFFEIFIYDKSSQKYLSNSGRWEMNWPMVAKVLIFFVLFAIFLNIGGCIRPADGISSTGGLFNPCKDECRKNADFLETMRHFSPEEIQWVHWADANGESGWIPSYSCDKCYP